MKLTLNCSLALAAALAALPASATTINFNNLTGANGSTFTSYSQGGYTVAATAGSVMVGQVFGNPVPDIYALNGTVNVVSNTASLFTFSSVDFGDAQNPGTEAYSVTGFLNGSQVYTFSGVLQNANSTFVTDSFGTSGISIDRLRIQLSEVNQGAGDGNIDNIVVNAAATTTPEPSGLMLLGTGILGVGAALRRRIVRV